MDIIRDLKPYFFQLKEALDCPPSYQKSFLSDAKRMALDYCHGNQHASPEDVMTFLGSPDELALSLMDSLDSETLTRYRMQKKIKKRIIGIILLIIICFLLIFSFYLLSLPITLEIEETLVIYH